jgi:hypothetical protein
MKLKYQILIIYILHLMIHILLHLTLDLKNYLKKKQSNYIIFFNIRFNISLFTFHVTLVFVLRYL